MDLKGLSKKQILLISLTTLILVAFVVSADLIIKADHDEIDYVTTEATSSEAAPAGIDAVYSEINSALTDDIEDEEYVPGPTVLNLAYFYEDEDSTDDVMNSYAGKMYSELATLEAQFLAELYDIYDTSPLDMAERLGFAAERVIGSYDPTDSSHDLSDTSTWTVNHFKNINIAFYDGDGDRINEYPLVKSILSMASVYSYYHDMYDADAMLEFALSLWEDAHSSSFTLGNVYYCSGCLDRTIEEEANEVLEQEREQQSLREALAKATARSAGDTALAVRGLGSLGSTESAKVSTTELNLSDTTSYETSAEASEGEPQESGTGSLELSSSAYTGDWSYVTGSETTGGTEEAADSAVSDTTAEASETLASIETEMSAHAYTDSESASYENAADSEVFSVHAQSSETGLSESVWLISEAEGTEDTSSEAESAAAVESSAGMTVEDTGGPESSEDPASNTEAAETSETAAGVTISETAGPADAINAAVNAALSALSDTDMEIDTEGLTGVESQAVTCPGHIDIYISVTIKGLDDENGLIAADTIGNDPDNFNDEWQGWTEDKLNEVRELNSQDWFARYGLTISAIAVGRTLSTEEISYYMSLLPSDTSQERRDIIKFALESVGKVPYYWGGKPYGAGYEVNSFGTITSPDEMGRVLRGLDCSGWINWVYWSVTGSSLPGESTGSLVGCGTRISREELNPGDIIIRTGADAHVVMFLCWAENGNMIVIHETGGVTNNVVVAEMTADWPYYRDLIGNGD